MYEEEDEEGLREILPGTHLHSLVVGAADVLATSNPESKVVSFNDICELVASAIKEGDWPEEFALETITQYPEIVLEVIDLDEEDSGSFTLEEFMVWAIYAHAIDIVLFLLEDKGFEIDLLSGEPPGFFLGQGPEERETDE